jgi:hypothetical protein
VCSRGFNLSHFTITTFRLSLSILFAVLMGCSGEVDISPTSEPKNLSSNTGPKITAQTNNQNVNAGATVILNVTAQSSESLSYQWSFNGVVQPFAISSSLVLTNVQVADSGFYTVTVKANSGEASASPIQVIVQDYPAPNGSYTLSCVSCTVEASNYTISCSCPDSSNVAHAASRNYASCPGSRMANIEGKLECE